MKFKNRTVQRFYNSVKKDFELEPHHLKVLENACACLERIYEDQAIIEKAGRFFTDRYGQPKEHPAAVSERQNKILFVRQMRELGLDIVTPEDPRPPRQYGS